MPRSEATRCTALTLLAFGVLTFGSCIPKDSKEPTGGAAAVDRGSEPSAPPPQNQASEAQDAGSDAQQVTPEPPAEPPGPKPLQAESEFQTLPVEGYRDGVIALPLGIKQKRPLLVALHGNYDRPEWQCMVWAELIQRQAFVVCPRGVPRTDAPKSEDRWTYGGIPDTLKETFAALAAARAAYPEYIDPGPAMFTGFSLGAIYGVHALGADAKKRAAYGAGEEPPFGYAVLVEGGYQGWYLGRAKQFRADGAQGVVFGCGQYACRAKASGLVKLLERADLRVGVGFGGNVGHTYDGQVAAAVAAELPAMFGDDPRWKPVVDALGAAESR
ncbi:MAG: hypothetical protein AB7K71_16815 [Polyangiaceae bacterium]